MSIGSLLSKKQMEREQFDRVERLFIHGGRKGVLREGGEYAVYYAKGPYEELTGKYRLFLEGIKRQGYRLDGDVYEEYLISELATGSPDQYVTRLTGKVIKTNKCS